MLTASLLLSIAPQQQPVQSPYGSQSYAPPQGPPPGAGYAPSQGAPTGYGAPQQQYQGGYGAPTGYGAPPQQMQQQQQQARPGGVSPQALEQCLRQVTYSFKQFLYTILTFLIQQCVVEQKIQAFYPPQALSGIAQQVAASGALEKVAQEWRLPMEIAVCIRCICYLLCSRPDSCYRSTWSRSLSSTLSCSLMIPAAWPLRKVAAELTISSLSVKLCSHIIASNPGKLTHTPP